MIRVWMKRRVPDGRMGMESGDGVSGNRRAAGSCVSLGIEMAIVVASLSGRVSSSCGPCLEIGLGLLICRGLCLSCLCGGSSLAGDHRP
jgi:hypothetical protein